MYDIKELTWEYHKNAERQAFVKVLMSGEIPEKLYAVFLYNQLQCYAALEKYAQENSLFRTTVGLQRAEHLLYDFNALWKDEKKPEIFILRTFTRIQLLMMRNLILFQNQLPKLKKKFQMYQI